MEDTLMPCITMEDITMEEMGIIVPTMATPRTAMEEMVLSIVLLQ
jgi:hypothetical protein